MNNQLVSSDDNNIIHIPSNISTDSNLQPLPNSTFLDAQLGQKLYPPSLKPFTINYSWDGLLPLTPISADELNSEWELFQFHQQKTKEHHLNKERKLTQILQQISQLYGQHGAVVVLQSLVSKLNNSNNGKPVSISELISAPNFHVLLDNIGRILEAKKTYSQ
ncbi:predicted protein [Naegleria gruberi]|uniref:Predicted protein n=1 Tax=Naegleria gruberi TaxID=5762 RepID=D2V757_NAEGR|nr:uncharacterized protein NAEGRDRAFT_64677 [Naegleria gruberi]EFC47312.1 predicted protein [Naegleria gruberi]|eukprot:XP_002680056.1 predicted protein [Naegleria gruberi strain NEG-M]